MPKERRRVAVGPKEARMAKMAERMREEGESDFHKIYGPREISPSEVVAGDVGEMSAMGMMSSEDATAVADNMNSDIMSAVEATSAVQPEAAPPVEQPVQPDHGPQIQLSEDPEERLEQVAKLLQDISPDNAPDAATLKSWKATHGGVFIMNVGDLVFIYRYLKRQEYIQLMANPKIEEMPEHQLEEKIFTACVMWPRMQPIQLAGMPAGAISMVVQQIRAQSMFLDPAYVATMTFKL